jgi:hypothetical protein
MRIDTSTDLLEAQPLSVQVACRPLVAMNLDPVEQRRYGLCGESPCGAEFFAVTSGYRPQTSAVPWPATRSATWS